MAVASLTRRFGKALRSVGQSLDSVGLTFQGNVGYVERLVPSTRVTSFKNTELSTGSSAFVASSATTVGDVHMAEGASVWYRATLRGDTAPVKVGRNSSVLDAVKVSAGVQIGDDCIICPAATLSAGVVIEDGAMIGAGAVLQPGVKVGKDAFVDAGAVVPANTAIPAGQLWTGVPARHLRDLSTDEMAYLRSSALHYATLATRHAAECAKTVQEVEYDTYLADWKAWMHMDAKEELPTVDPYMVQYYQLSRGQSVSQDQGLFREKEYDDAALRQAKLEAEVQSDLAEDEYYADLASLERVGSAVAALASTPVHMTVQRDDILTDLEHTDERAAAFMQDLLARAAAAADDEAAAADVLDDLRSLDSNKDSLARGMDAELQLSQLAAHARTLKHGLPAMPRVAAYLDK